MIKLADKIVLKTVENMKQLHRMQYHRSNNKQYFLS